MAVFRGAHTSRSAESTTTIVGYNAVHALEKTFENYFYALALPPTTGRIQQKREYFLSGPEEEIPDVG